MNILSLIGLSVLIAVVCIALYLEVDKGIPLENYFQKSGLAIVIGGAFGAGFLKSSSNDFKAAWSLLPRAFMNPIPSRLLIDQLVEFSDIARRTGGGHSLHVSNFHQCRIYFSASAASVTVAA